MGAAEELSELNGSRPIVHLVHARVPADGPTEHAEGPGAGRRAPLLNFRAAVYELKSAAAAANADRERADRRGRRRERARGGRARERHDVDAVAAKEHEYMYSGGRLDDDEGVGERKEDEVLTIVDVPYDEEGLEDLSLIHI